MSIYINDLDRLYDRILDNYNRFLNTEYIDSLNFKIFSYKNNRKIYIEDSTFPNELKIFADRLIRKVCNYRE